MRSRLVSTLLDACFACRKGKSDGVQIGAVELSRCRKWEAGSVRGPVGAKHTVRTRPHESTNYKNATREHTNLCICSRRKQSELSILSIATADGPRGPVRWSRGPTSFSVDLLGTWRHGAGKQIF